MTHPAANPTAHPVAHDFLTSPGADIRDAGATDISSLRAELNSNLFLFAWVIFGYKDLTPAFHLPICRFLERWGSPPGAYPGGTEHYGHTRLMLIQPRETFKTSLATRANGLQQVCKSKGHGATVAIFNRVEDNAKDWIGHIRRVVETSREFQDIYRDMLPKGVHYSERDRGVTVPRKWHWNDSGLDFVRDTEYPERSISGWGVSGSATGRHWTHMIKDDIIGEKEARSPGEMAAVRHWCETARMLERPAEKGNELLVYTRWSYSDVYRYIREQWPDDYLVFHRRALDRNPDTGEEYSTFPEKWTTAELQRMRSNPRRAYFFAAQMQSEPRAGEETSFNPEWNRYGTVVTTDRRSAFVIDPDHYNPEITQVESEPAPRNAYLSQLDKALLWDPAPSDTKRRAEDEYATNGMVAAAMDPWGRTIVLEAKGTRLDPTDTMRLAIEMCIKWGIDKIACEEVNFSSIYKFWGDYLLEREYPTAGIQFIPQREERRNKDARIQGLIPAWRNGFIYLNAPECQQLIREANEYPHGSTRDLLDALANRDAVLARPKTTGELTYDDWQRTRHAGSGDRTRGPHDSVNWGH